MKNKKKNQKKKLLQYKLKPEDKKELRNCDILMWGSFVLMLAARVLTFVYFSKVEATTGADIENIITLYEINPLFKMFLGLKQIGQIIGVMIIPAAAMAVFYLYRNRVTKGLLKIEILQFFVNFGFFVFLMDVFNDLALVIGRLI